MELRRIVINKEIITQKLSSSKNLTTKRIVRLTNMRNIFFCEKITECPNPPKETIVNHRQDFNQTNENENKINKQQIEIRQNKHKSYFQSKNLDRYKDQSNKEEH